MHNYTQTPVRNRPSYLFLRRYTGEAIVLLAPRHSEVWIRVIEIDVDDPGVILDITGLSQPLRLDLFESRQILQGTVELKLQALQESERDDMIYASIGVSTDRSTRILRDELLAGLSRAERAALVR